MCAPRAHTEVPCDPSEEVIAATCTSMTFDLWLVVGGGVVIAAISSGMRFPSSDCLSAIELELSTTKRRSTLSTRVTRRISGCT
jgi:hypothetical protein